jgi:hypothetical protein
MNYLDLSAEYIAENFKVISGNILIEVLKKGDKFDLGFLNSESKTSLLEEPTKIAINDITLEELIKLKESIVTLINRVEKESKVK